MPKLIGADTKHTCHLAFPAMATEFEVWLLGEDQEHLEAVGNLVKDEIQRIEILLSRYTPASDIFRINREACMRPVKVDRELFNVLTDCLKWYEKTEGYFDISVFSKKGNHLADRIRLNFDRQTIFFNFQEVLLDLGGYGKGYALEKVGKILKVYGIGHYFIHGGGSSAKAMGNYHGNPWTIAYRRENKKELIHLEGRSFSCSETDPNDLNSIVTPFSKKSSNKECSCYAIGPEAIGVEVYTTALVAMGREKALTFVNNMDEQIAVQLF